MDVARATRFGRGRKRVKPRRDRKVFARTASRSRAENFMTGTMRGGTRL